VVEPTPLKNMLVEFPSFPQIFGMKIKNMFELPPISLDSFLRWDKFTKILIVGPTISASKKEV